MKLSLARWDYQGCSAGWWMVRELPGVTITLVDTGFSDQAWRIDSEPDLFQETWDGGVQDSWPLAWELWGDDFSFTDISGLPERFFPTRSAALLALESAFSDAPGSALCEALS